MAALSLLAAPPSDGQPLSFSRTDYAVGVSPIGIVVGNFDTDSHQDIVVVNNGNNSFSYLRGAGDGTFLPPVSFSAAASGAAAGPITAADFNLDGNLDVAIAHPGTTALGFGNAVTIHFGDGIGGFSTPGSVFTTGGSNTGLDSGDVNGDGKPDIVVGACDSGLVHLHYGNGDGTFAPPQNLGFNQCGGSSGLSVHAAGLTGAGSLDIVAANHGDPNRISVFVNMGAGFGPRTHYSPVGDMRGPSLASGDFNGDGYQDVAVGAQLSNLVSVLLGNGLGGLGSPVPFPAGQAPADVGLADFDGDGSLDVVVPNPSVAEVSVLLGNGAGGLGAPLPFPVGALPVRVAAGDFNGDGRADVAVANNDASSVTVLISDVADSTPPEIDPAISGAEGTNGWFTSAVTVEWTVEDPDSPITSSDGCSPTTLTFDTAGADLTCMATSAGGPASETVTVKIDKTPPSVSVSGVADQGVYDIGNVPAAGCTTSDSLSGVFAEATLSVTGGDNGVGVFTAVCSGAQDNAGNIADPVSVSYQVHYGFDGFFAPVSNSGLNRARAGQTIPIKWTITGESGGAVTTLTAVTSLDSAPISCGASDVGALVPADTSGSSGLRYDEIANQYHFTWKTSAAWSGTCRRFVLTLDDQSTHTADFQFR